MYLNRIKSGALAMAGAAVMLTACAGGTDSPTSPSSKLATGKHFFAALTPAIGTGSTLEEEKFIVCKEFVGGTVTTANFQAAITSFDSRYASETINFSLTDGQCADFGYFGAAGVNVTVTETAITDYVTTYTRETFLRVQGQLGSSSGASNPAAGRVVTDSAYGDRPNADGGIVARGTRIVYTNTYNAPPPPPPGTQGCTPGYWKQSQHFGSWVGYTQLQRYETVFGVQVPGNPTLLDALGANGGGINALMRHSTAALLNAANNAVNYGRTPAQVIAATQAAIASGNYETQKDIFAGWNERGCPLGRNPGVAR